MVINKQDASKKIAELIAQAQKLVYEAENVADESGVGFSMNLGDYGMGGYYEPTPPGEENTENEYGESEYGWRASSQSC